MENCKCGLKKQKYYADYCPKCDIQKIIKHKKNSWCIIPILNYGNQFIEGFDDSIIWKSLDKSLRNDSYYEYYFELSEEYKPDEMLKKVLKELNIPIEEDGSILFWVSW